MPQSRGEIARPGLSWLQIASATDDPCPLPPFGVSGKPDSRPGVVKMGVFRLNRLKGAGNGPKDLLKQVVQIWAFEVELPSEAIESRIGAQVGGFGSRYLGGVNQPRGQRCHLPAPAEAAVVGLALGIRRRCLASLWIFPKFAGNTTSGLFSRTTRLRMARRWLTSLTSDLAPSELRPNHRRLREA